MELYPSGAQDGHLIGMACEHYLSGEQKQESEVSRVRFEVKNLACWLVCLLH